MQPPTDPDELIAWISARHGRARAEAVRWRGFLEVCRRLYVASRRRKEAALLEALEALERAQRYEEREERWIRVATWVARRVDRADAHAAQRARLFTRIDFSTQTTTEELRPTDIDESEDIEW
ncbi:MAG: hypothetical protein EBS48_05145 [Actinobacteria bacterium]|nr:hypothetical protein [Actinomycetota bacterium]